MRNLKIGSTHESLKIKEGAYGFIGIQSDENDPCL